MLDLMVGTTLVRINFRKSSLEGVYFERLGYSIGHNHCGFLHPLYSLILHHYTIVSLTFLHNFVKECLDNVLQEESSLIFFDSKENSHLDEERKNKRIFHILQTHKKNILFTDSSISTSLYRILQTHEGK